jgi:methylpurine-DNA glycosylase (MPG)
MGRADTLKPGRHKGGHPPLSRAELPVDTVSLAGYLIGKILLQEMAEGVASGRIVETEAYIVGDAAGHAHRGMTPRNQSLSFASAGMPMLTSSVSAKPPPDVAGYRGRRSDGPAFFRLLGRGSSAEDRSGPSRSSRRPDGRPRGPRRYGSADARQNSAMKQPRCVM